MIIADTGFWVALVNADDKHHQAAIDAFSRLREPLITTWPVLTETCHLLLKRMGIEAELGFIRSLRQGSFIVFDLREDHHSIILNLMEKNTLTCRWIWQMRLWLFWQKSCVTVGYSALISATFGLIAGRILFRFRTCCLFIESG